MTEEKHPTLESIAEASPLFWAFISHYPAHRKVKIYMAWIEWTRDGLDAVFKDIMDGLQRYRDSEKWNANDGWYVENPDKFLKERMWMDHPRQMQD
jgi:hypothetical protein